VATLIAGLQAADGVAPLLDAVKRGDRAAARRLIATRADVNSVEADGTTPLHWAVRNRDGELVQLLLRAGAKASAEKRAAFLQGAQAFRSPFVQRTGLGEAWPPPMMVSLQDELRAAHCGQVPGHVVIGMMRVQRARDAMMADRLAATSGRGGGVLIAGNAHVRRDRGVPWYLARLRPDARTVSIGLIEVGGDLPALADLPYDYVWFTSRIDNADDDCDTHDTALEQWLQAG
jgi:hypothetical protein